MSAALVQQLLFDSGRWGGHVGVDACARTVHAGGFSDVYWTMSFGWGHQRKVKIVTFRIGNVWWRVHSVSILSGSTVWIHAFLFLSICSRQKAAILKELKTTSSRALRHDTLPTLTAKLDEILQVAKEAEKLTSFYSSCRNLLVRLCCCRWIKLIASYLLDRFVICDFDDDDDDEDDDDGGDDTHDDDDEIILGGLIPGAVLVKVAFCDLIRHWRIFEAKFDLKDIESEDEVLECCTLGCGNGDRWCFRKSEQQNVGCWWSDTASIYTIIHSCGFNLNISPCLLWFSWILLAQTSSMYPPRHGLHDGRSSLGRGVAPMDGTGCGQVVWDEQPLFRGWPLHGMWYMLLIFVWFFMLLMDWHRDTRICKALRQRVPRMPCCWLQHLGVCKAMCLDPSSVYLEITFGKIDSDQKCRV